MNSSNEYREKSIKGELQYYFDNPNYLYLLIAIVALLINGAFSIKFESFQLARDISFGIVIFLGPFYASRNSLSFAFHFSLGVIIFIIFQSSLLENLAVNTIHSTFLFIFFYLLFHKVIVNVWNQRVITFNYVVAVVCGYLVLGIMSAFIFKIIDILIANSYSIESVDDYFNFIYFSFITLTSIGFGDIVPLNAVSKMATVILSITGQIYITVIMAIFVAKYIAHNNFSKTDQ